MIRRRLVTADGSPLPPPDVDALRAEIAAGPADTRPATSARLEALIADSRAWTARQVREQLGLAVPTGAQPAPAAPYDPGRVPGTAPAYQQYRFRDVLALAHVQIGQALDRLGRLNDRTSPDEPDMITFRAHFSATSPADVAQRLRGTLAQLRHYAPEAPADPQAPGAGHACYDDAIGNVLIKNDGVGAEARMICGPLLLPLTLNARSYNMVHEATHGTPGLVTVDHSYGHQHRFALLTPAEQDENADSYALLVGRLCGLSKAPPGTTTQEDPSFDLDGNPVDATTTTGLDPAQAKLVKLAWAWVQHCLTQAYLDVRDLPRAIDSGVDLSEIYSGKLLRAIRSDLGPSDNVEAVADDLDTLMQFVTYQPVVFAAPGAANGAKFRMEINPMVTDMRPTARHLLRSAITYALPDAQVDPWERLVSAIVALQSLGGPLQPAP